MRFIILLLILILNLSASEKVALVIGNQNYTNQTELKNPISDVKMIKSTLEGMDFKVMFAYNQELDGLDIQLNKFMLKAKKSKIAVIYYAGHGLGVNGINYLIPLKTENLRINNLDRKLMRVNELKSAVAQASEFGVVFFDACRNSFFNEEIEGLDGTRDGASRGLAQPTVRGQNVLVSLSTQAGKIAKDDVNGGKHSPYAIALKEKLILNKDIHSVMRGVRDKVLELTNGMQEPVNVSSLGEKDCCMTGDCNPIPKAKARIIQIGKIMYQNQPFTKKYSLKKAKKYCQNLTLGRYRDWRLPSKEELIKVSNIGMYNGELKYWNIWFDTNENRRIRGRRNSHFVRPEFIHNFTQKDSHFWTWRRGSSFAWIVNFKEGSCGKDDLSHKKNKHFALCVRII